MAYLNGIDISHWQKGLNVNAVPHDFIIAKATQGTSMVDECCAGFVETERSRGGLFGTYHYISGGNANGEAEHYIRSISNWVGEGILCLDWESKQNSAWGNVGYLDSVTKRVVELTGIPPVLYGSRSVYSQLKQVADKYNCGLWIAQYPNNNTTGYQDTPWNEGAYGCAIRQYTSSGRLSGYSGNLDLDKFYGDANAWKAYAGSSSKKPADKNANIQLYDGNATDAQRWSVEHVDGGYVRLISVSCGLALDVRNGNGVSGNDIWVYTPNGTDSQLWKIIQKNPEAYNPDYATPVEIAPKLNENLRLDVYGGGKENGTKIWLYDSNGTSAQEWSILDHGDGTWTFINVGSSQALDVVGGGK